MRSKELLLQRIIHPEYGGAKMARTFVGDEVAELLREGVQRYVAQQVHAITVEKKDYMEIVSEDEVLKNMKQGTIVLKLGEKNEVLGFAQLSEDIHDFRRMVVRTWIGKKLPGYESGSGAWAMQSAAQFAFNRQKFPATREVVTRVKYDNEAPQRVLEQMGAEHEGTVTSPKTGRTVKVYNLTMVGLGRKN